MADIRGMVLDQSVIRAECDQKVMEAWRILHYLGEDWVDGFDEMTRAFAEHDQQPWQAVGMIAQIGFLHMLASHNPFDGDLFP